jgi:transcriptional regulator PpsR
LRRTGASTLPDISESHDLNALAPWAREVAITLARVASDVAIVIDGEGVIRTVAESGSPLPAGCNAWVGQRWVDTVTADTRRKIELLLDEVRASGVTQRREVSHPAAEGDSLPLSWTAIRLGDRGPVIAVGRDLRAVASIQQRFVEAQQEMEQAYWQRRAADSRYRLLFHAARDAVFVLDAQDLSVIEGNEAAERVFGGSDGALAGRPLADLLPEPARNAALELVAKARSSGSAGEIGLRTAPDRPSLCLSATPFRAGDRLQLLVRAHESGEGDGGVLPPMMRRLVEAMPDAVVITDSVGRIVMGNPAFVTLVHGASESALKARLLPEVVDDVQGAWASTIERTREHGLCLRVPLRIHAADRHVEVEVSATLLTEGEQQHLGFTLRLLEAAAPVRGVVLEAWPGLTDLRTRIGAVPLAGLLHEASEAVERQLILTALRKARNGLEAAADLLSLTPAALVGRLEALEIGARGSDDPAGAGPPLDSA